MPLQSRCATALANHRGAIARAFAISALGSITYYVGITYVPAFLTSAGALSEASHLWLSTIAAVIVILVTPLSAPGPTASAESRCSLALRLEAHCFRRRCSR